MQFVTILDQISILGILAVIGIIAFRTKIINDNAKDVIEKIVFYITLPLMIVTKLSSLQITDEILRNGGLIIVFTYLIIFIQMGVGKLTARLLHLEPRQAVIHSMHTYLGNIVFLGFPLLDALFPGGEAILYAALYQLVMNTVLWTAGVMQLNPSVGVKGLANLKKLLNPNTIALSIGLLMMIFEIRFPALIQKSFSGLGSTTLYLAMLYIGILLAKTKIRKMFTKPDVLVVSLNKLFLLPVLFLFLVNWLVTFMDLPMNHTAFSTLILEAAMPCMTILVLLAKRFGADDQKAMENFVVTTILSIVTLPFIIYLIGLVQM